MSYEEMVDFVMEKMQETQELKKQLAAVEEESRNSSRNRSRSDNGMRKYRGVEDGLIREED
jgi:hypothetical protein